MNPNLQGAFLTGNIVDEIPENSLVLARFDDVRFSAGSQNIQTGDLVVYKKTNGSFVVVKEVQGAGNFAEYSKNGFKINASTLDDAYEHVDAVEFNGAGEVKYGVGGLVGCHNEINFKNQIITNGGRVEIISETPSNVLGVKEINYKVLKNDGAGGFLGDPNTKVFKKTTFDPLLIPPTTMKEYGYLAIRSAMDNQTYDLAKQSFTGFANGRTIEGYFQTVNGENIIKTWWIKN